MKSKIILAFLLLALGLSTAYVVKDGDTLWDISDVHFENPFKWPEIWESNPHIANPHLIYPGDTLNFNLKMSQQDDLSGFGVPKKNNQDLTKISFENRKSSFLSKVGDLKDNTNKYKDIDSKIGSVLEPIKNNRLAILNHNLQLSAPELMQPLNDIRLIKDQFEVQFDDRANGNILKEQQIAIIKGGSENGIQPGDLIQFFNHTRNRIVGVTKTNKKELYPYKLLGIGKVIEVAPRNARVVLLKNYHSIMPFHTRAAKYKKLKSPKIKSYQPVTAFSKNDMATIIHRFKLGSLSQRLSWIGIDKGLSSGYSLGDAVAIWERKKKEDSKLSPKLIGTGLVVKALDKNATILIRNLLEASNLPTDLDRVSITHKAVQVK
jgi:hypothetical protein